MNAILTGKRRRQGAARMRNEIKKKIRGLGSAALEELNQSCCMLFSVNEADNRSLHFTLTFRCQQHGRYWCAVQYVEDIPDDLIKTEIKIEVLNRAFLSVGNGSNKNSNGSGNKNSNGNGKKSKHVGQP